MPLDVESSLAVRPVTRHDAAADVSPGSALEAAAHLEAVDLRHVHVEAARGQGRSRATSARANSPFEAERTLVA